MKALKDVWKTGINMGLLTQTEFLTKAAELFAKSNGTRSSLYITQKRLITPDEIEGNEADKNQISQFSEAKPLLESSKIITNSTKSYPILIRITDGNSDKAKKVKISTQVNAKELSKFWKNYSNVIKSGVIGLKKKDKKKKKKKKKKPKNTK